MSDSDDKTGAKVPAAFGDETGANVPAAFGDNTGANAPHGDGTLELDMNAMDDRTQSRLALSVLMDGEAGDEIHHASGEAQHLGDVDSLAVDPTARALDDCQASPELTRAWQGYHLVRSVMRKDYCGAEVNGLAMRVSAAIANEPALTAALEPRGDASAPAPSGARRGDRGRGDRGRDWRTAVSKRPGAGIATGHRPAASARAHNARYTATAVASGAVLGVAVWLAIGSGLGDNNGTDADGIAATGAGARSAQVATAEVPPAATVSDTQTSGNVVLASAPADITTAYSESADFDMTPQRHRRLSELVVQHAEFQGGGAGYPVMPYVVLVGGTAQ